MELVSYMINPRVIQLSGVSRVIPQENILFLVEKKFYPFRMALEPSCLCNRSVSDQDYTTKPKRSAETT